MIAMRQRVIPLFLVAARAHPTESESKPRTAVIGRWDVRWTRPENWQPRHFTGVLDVRDGDDTGAAKILFREIVPPGFRPGTATFAGDAAEISFAFGQAHDGLKLRVTAHGDVLHGEATMPGRIGWSSFDGTRVAPPADLPGRPLVPYEVAATPPTEGLRPQDAWELPTGPVPWLTADGTRLWSVQAREGAPCS